MNPEHFDLLVLGSGPAGTYAALGGARAGLRTALAEAAELGGTGFRWGCLPVKMALDGLRAARRAGGRLGGRALGDRGLPSRLAPRLAGVEQRLERDLSAAGVTLIRGAASFLDPHTVEAGGELLQAAVVAIATGTHPAAPPGIGLDGRLVLSHADLFRLPRLPRSAVVVGADVEGVELACLLAGCGTRVCLLEKEPEILPGQDRDLTGPVQESLAALGVRFRLGAAAAGVRARAGGAVVELADGSALQTERVVVTGLRAPNLPAGLEAAGVRSAGDHLPVDSLFRTSAAHIYAIGDVNGLCGMAHAAVQQGMLLPALLRGGNPAPQSYPTLPRAMYTLPEVAGAGRQERELERQGVPFRRSLFPLADTWRGISREIREGFMKVLAAPDGRLLGIWACAEDASELAAPFGFLLERGATLEELRRSLFLHPTLAEGLLEAVRLL